MARVPTQIRKRSVNAPRTATASGAGAGLRAIGDAIAETGRDIRNRHEAERRQREADKTRERRAADAQANARFMAEAQLEWGRQLVTRQDAITGDGSGFVDTFDADFNTWRDEQLAQVPAHRRAALTTDLTRTHASLSLRAFEIERLAGRGYALGQVEDTRQTLEAAILSNPGQYDDARDVYLESVIGLDVIDEAGRLEVMQEGLSSLGAAYISGMVREDPDALLARLNSGGLDDELDPAVKERGINAATAEIDRRAAQAERIAREQARAREAAQAQRDMITLIEQSALADDHVASLATTGVAVDGFDREAFQRVSTPRSYAAFVAQESAAIAAHEVIAGIDGLPDDEIAARLEAAAPVAGAGGFAQAEAVHEIATRAAVQAIEARRRDPARYAMNSAPVREAIDVRNGLEDPEATELIQANERVIQATLAEQERLGLAPSERRVLPVPQARSLIAEFEAASASDRGQAMLQLVAGVQAYGAYMPQVLRQLHDEGLPEEAEAVIALEGDAGAQALLARAVTSWDSVREIVPQADRNDAAREVAQQMEPLLATFEGVDGSERLSALAVGAATKIAALRMSQGASANDAAREAAGAFRGRYHIAGSVRIPQSVAMPRMPEQVWHATGGPNGGGFIERSGAGILSRGYTAGDHIELALQNEMRSLASADGPREFSTEIGLGADRAERRAATVDAIRATGRWVTNEDETGVYLVIGEAGLAVPVIDRSGHRIDYDWTELIARGRVRPVNEDVRGDMERFLYRQATGE